MRNRTPSASRDETAFIHGGSAGIDASTEQPKNSKILNKAKPISISFSEKNLRDIDDIIRGEMRSSGARANRSDVVRAAVTAVKNQSKCAISALIKEAKLK